MTGEPGRVCESVSVTAEDGTVDAVAEVENGGVCDWVRGGVWGTRGISF